MMYLPPVMKSTVSAILVFISVLDFSSATSTQSGSIACKTLNNRNKSGSVSTVIIFFSASNISSVGSGNDITNLKSNSVCNLTNFSVPHAFFSALNTSLSPNARSTTLNRTKILSRENSPSPHVMFFKLSMKSVSSGYNPCRTLNTRYNFCLSGVSTAIKLRNASSASSSCEMTFNTLNRTNTLSSSVRSYTRFMNARTVSLCLRPSINCVSVKILLSSSVFTILAISLTNGYFSPYSNDSLSAT